MITMLISGGLAGLMAINAVMGEAERLVIELRRRARALSASRWR